MYTEMLFVKMFDRLCERTFLLNNSKGCLLLFYTLVVGYYLLCAYTFWMINLG